MKKNEVGALVDIVEIGPTYAPTALVTSEQMASEINRTGRIALYGLYFDTNRTEILSSVDHFDFNWHINYVYADEAAPLLPAGTVLHMIGIHDNTSANRRNPDPNMWVGFGERSVDDMLQVWINVVYLDDAEFQGLVEARGKPASTNAVERR